VRPRLTLLVAATACLVLVAFLVPLALLVRTVAADRAISSAAARMQAVVLLIGSGERADVDLGLASAGRPITVFTPAGEVLGEPAERTPAVRLAATGISLSTDTPRGREMVQYVGRGDGGYVIRTVVTRAEMTRGVTRAWAVLAGLGLLLVLLGLLVADRLARTLIVPMRDLSAVSHRLAGGDLSARAVPAGPPEVRAAGRALNHLAGRIRELLDAERETVADLSHRLRTPLTALRLEASALSDPAEADRIGAQVDALQRAVSELIRAARHRADERGACDATEVVGDRVRFWSALADDTDRAVTAALPAGPVPVGLPAGELAAALDALLGNVFAHTPDGTPFAVTLSARDGGGALLTVADSGPGLPDTIRAGGGRGLSEGGSTGLGLDIAARAARASGGALTLATAPTAGATITLTLGPPARSARS
jgi:signal transduction histidine kinase